jgi:hypothetical protein
MGISHLMLSPDFQLLFQQLHIAAVGTHTGAENNERKQKLFRSKS